MLPLNGSPEEVAALREAMLLERGAAKARKDRKKAAKANGAPTASVAMQNGASTAARDNVGGAAADGAAAASDHGRAAANGLAGPGDKRKADAVAATAAAAVDGVAVVKRAKVRCGP